MCGGIPCEYAACEDKDDGNDELVPELGRAGGLAWFVIFDGSYGGEEREQRGEGMCGLEDAEKGEEEEEEHGRRRQRAWQVFSSASHLLACR